VTVNGFIEFQASGALNTSWGGGSWRVDSGVCVATWSGVPRILRLDAIKQRAEAVRDDATAQRSTAVFVSRNASTTAAASPSPSPAMAAMPSDMPPVPRKAGLVLNINRPIRVEAEEKKAPAPSPAAAAAAAASASPALTLSGPDDLKRGTSASGATTPLPAEASDSADPPQNYWRVVTEGTLLVLPRPGASGLTATFRVKSVTGAVRGMAVLQRSTVPKIDVSGPPLTMALAEADLAQPPQDDAVRMRPTHAARLTPPSHETESYALCVVCVVAGPFVGETVHRNGRAEGAGLLAGDHHPRHRPVCGARDCIRIRA
jgi:hypothetical protein